MKELSLLILITLCACSRIIDKPNKDCVITTHDTSLDKECKDTVELVNMNYTCGHKDHELNINTTTLKTWAICKCKRR